jgi:hypothetical protein
VRYGKGGSLCLVLLGDRRVSRLPSGEASAIQVSLLAFPCYDMYDTAKDEQRK